MTGTRQQLRLVLAAAWAAAVLLTAAPAAASPWQESIFQDDSELVYGSDRQVEKTLASLRSLGVDRVRVTVLWRLIAPDPSSTTRPNFGAGGPTDPRAYSPGAWDRYDRIVEGARRYGLAVLFNITGPGPVWATANPGEREPMLDPRAGDFGAFVTAVGRRYSGSYADERVEPAPARPPCSGGLPPIIPPNCPPAPPAPAPRILPRVDMWSIWNEPNQPGWLRPQGTRVSGRAIPGSPHLYRALQDAGHAALRTSGHGSDGYLLAETAPRGSIGLGRVAPMRPLVFVRELYCVGRNLRPYRGRAARIRGCPTSAAGRRSFAAKHPGLFRATGFAHHPYALELPPSKPDPTADQVTLATLPRLTRSLDRIFRRYGVSRRIPIWLTEYGYQTDPPDPLIGVSWARQAAYLNESDDMAYRDYRVQSVAQFLLVDDGPNREVPPTNLRYWGSTFQSGLISLEGRAKPALEAYARPLHVSPRSARRGRKLRVFGQLRSARNGASIRGRLEFLARGSRSWRNVKRVSTRSYRNYVVTSVRARKSGAFRLAWRNPSGGGTLHSRAVGFRVRAR